MEVSASLLYNDGTSNLLDLDDSLLQNNVVLRKIVFDEFLRHCNNDIQELESLVKDVELGVDEEEVSDYLTDLTDYGSDDDSLDFADHSRRGSVGSSSAASSQVTRSPSPISDGELPQRLSGDGNRSQEQ